MMDKPKLVRITTVPISMNIILRGQLGFMNQYFEVVGVSGYDLKHYNEIAEREGIRMKTIEIARDISILKDFKTLWDLYKFLNKEKPEIVHTHTPKAGLLGMIASRLAKVPVRLHTVGGIPQIELKGWKRKVLDLTEKTTYLFAHKIFPNSKGLEKFILKMKYCKSSKVKVLANGSSNGVDTEYFKPEYINNIDLKKSELRKEIGLNDDDIVFLFVGRIAKDKGIDELVGAFNKINEEYDNTRLILIGPFEKKYGVINSQTKSLLKKNKSILLLGRFDDVRPYYILSDIFVLPSYREGFPNAVLEAQSMGLPGIVTNINGCNEIIEDSINGIIIPLKSSDKLYEAMKKLINDEKYRLSLASNTRKSIVENYKQEIIWDALLKEYKTMLKSKLGVIIE